MGRTEAEQALITVYRALGGGRMAAATGR
jgi:hypothetical protein